MVVSFRNEAIPLSWLLPEVYHITTESNQVRIPVPVRLIRDWIPAITRVQLQNFKYQLDSASPAFNNSRESILFTELVGSIEHSLHELCRRKGKSDVCDPSILVLESSDLVLFCLHCV